MSTPDRTPPPDSPPPGERPGWGTLFVRWGIGAIMVLGGIICLILNPGGFGTEGFSMAVGGGLSVIMLNWIFRLGVSGDREREAEEAARRYLERHGHWPDEPPRPPRTPRPSRGAGGPRTGRDESPRR